MLYWGAADATVAPEIGADPGMEQAAGLVEHLIRTLPGIAARTELESSRPARFFS